MFEAVLGLKRCLQDAIRKTAALGLSCILALAPLSGAEADSQYLFRMQGVIAPLPVLTVLGPSPIDGHVTSFLSDTYTSMNGFGPVTWSATGLPPGLSISSLGVVSGTPSASGESLATIIATDSAGNVGTLPVDVIVYDQLRIIDVYNVYTKIREPVTIPTPTVVGNPIAPVKWSVASGVLPLGLSLNASTGVISGTPVVAGTTTLTVEIQDATSASAVSASFTIEVDGGLPINRVSDMQTRVGQSFQSLAPSVSADGVAPYTWSLVSGTLPAGLSVDPGTGEIIGTATVEGVQSNIVLGVTDAHGSVGDTNAFAISVLPALQFVAQQADVMLRDNFPLNVTIASPALNSPLESPYQWFIASGSLPDGLIFDTHTGNISGTPNLLGYTELTLGVEDGSGQQVNAAPFSITVEPALTVSDPGSFVIRVGQTLSDPAPIIGGGTDSALVVSAPGMNTEFTVDPATGMITGPATAAATGVYSYVLRDPTPHQTDYTVTSLNSATFTVLGQLVASFGNGSGLDPITSASYASHVNTAVFVDLLAGPEPTGDVAWNLVSGTLPPGLTLGPDPLNTARTALQGTLTTVGNYSFVLQAVDQSGNATPQTTFSIDVYPPLAGIPAPVTAYVGQYFSALQPAAVANTVIGMASFAFASDNVPGVSVTSSSNAETIGGILTTPGTYQVVWNLTDSSTTPAVQVVNTVTVLPAIGLQAANISTHVGDTVLTPAPTVDPGATLPLSNFSLISPNNIGLPAGLSLDPVSGVISGVPTAQTSGTLYGFGLSAIDSAGLNLIGAFSVTVAGSLFISGAGEAYITRVGTPMLPIPAPAPDSNSVVAPATWSLAQGVILPTGISLDPSTGIVSGTATDPTQVGSYNVALTLTDATGATATSPASILQVLAPLAIDPIGSQTFTVGSPLSYTPIPLNQPGIEQSPSCNPSVTACNVTWTLSGSPDVATLASDYGVTFNPATGQLTGTPTSPLPAQSYALTVSDDQGSSSPPMSFMLAFLTANGNLVVQSPPPTYVGDSAFAMPPPTVPSGAIGPLTWQVATGSLPSGLSLNPDGSISGTPAVAGSSNLSLILFDSTNASWTSNVFTIVVNAALSTSFGGGNPPSMFFRIGVDGPIQTVPQPTVGGGLPPFVWSFTGNGDPTSQSLSFNSSNGVFSGTPTGAANVYSLSYVVHDSSVDQQSQTSQPFNLTILAPLSFQSSAPVCDAASGAQDCKTGTEGSAFQSNTPPAPVVMPVPGFLWSLASGSLPPGLNLDPQTGVATGIPSTSGNFVYALKATDSDGAVTSNTWIVSVTINVNIAIGTLPDQTWRVTSNGSDPTFGLVSGIDGITSADFTVLPTVTGLPNGAVFATTPVYPWVVANASGIYGRPAQSGSFPLALTVTDPVTQASAVSNTANITVLPQLDLAPMPNATTIVGGTAMIEAPDVSGNPVAPLHWHYISQETDYYQPNGSLGGFSFVLDTGTAVVSNCSCLTGAEAANLSIVLPSGWTSSVTSYAIPKGLSLDTSVGLISGTPTVAGTVNMRLFVDDQGGGFATTNPFTVTVSPGFSLAAQDQLLRYGLAMTPYSPTINGTLTEPATWSVITGSLPVGLSLDPSTGVISGTPTTLGPERIAVQATDAAGSTAYVSFNLTVQSPLQVATIQSQQVHQGQQVTLPGQMVSNNPVAPVTWTVTPGYSLPDGLTLSPSDGSISGTALTVSTTPVDLTVTDAQGATATFGVFSIYVLPPLTLASAPDLTFHYNFASNAAAPVESNGVAPIHWALTPSGLPTGLSFSASTGTIGGAADPSDSGTQSYAYVVSDALGEVVTSNTFNLNIVPMLLAFPPANTTARVGVPATFTPSDEYAVGSLVWSLNNGAIPPGMSIGSDGSISGSPTAYGSFTQALQVFDSTGATASTGNFSINVLGPLTSTTPANIQAHVGEVVSNPGPTLGGDPYGNVTFTLTLGTLPDGLNIDPMLGTIAGRPTTPGTVSLAETASDSLGSTITTAGFMATIYPAMTIDAPATTTYEENQSVNLQMTVENAQGSVMWSAASLPDGLSMSTSGVLNGSTSFVGTRMVTIMAIDSIGGTASYALSLTFNPVIQVATPASDNGHVGQALNFTAPVVTNGTATPLSWSLVQGSLPSGLVLNSDGSISGTTTAQVASILQLQVTDANGVSAQTGQFNLQILPAITVAAVSSAIIHQGVRYTAIATPVPMNDVAPDSWTVSSGSLPTGLAISPTNGALGGTASGATGVYNMTEMVTDSYGSSATTNSYSVTVVAPLTVATPYNAQLHEGQSIQWTPPAVNNQVGSLAWSINGGALPNGISLNAATGALTGSAATGSAGSYTLTLKVMDSASGSVVSSSFIISVFAPATLSTPAGQTLHSGDTVAIAAPTVSGSPDTPDTFSLDASSASLPTGVSLNSSTGAISGSPSASIGSVQTNNLIVDATDQTGYVFKTGTIPLIVYPPLSGTLPATDYTHVGLANAITEPSLSNAIGALTWSASGLPSPLTIAPSTGLISGTATASGTYSVTITAKDTTATPNGTLSQAVTLYVLPALSISSMSNGTAYNGVAYSSTAPTVSNAAPTSAVTWSLQGSLPTGLSFSNGAISGTPTVTGTFSGLVINATDATGASVSTNTFTITVNPVANASTVYPSSVSTHASSGSVVATNLSLGALLDNNTTPASTVTLTPSVSATDGIVYTYSAPVAANSYSCSGGCTNYSLYYYNTSTSAWTAVGSSSVIASQFGLFATGSQVGSIYGFQVGNVSGGVTSYPSYVLSLNPATINLTQGVSMTSTTFDSAMSVANSSGTITYSYTGATVSGDTSGLPPGVTVSGNTISGTPSATGTYVISVTAVDSHGITSAPQVLTFAVAAATADKVAFTSGLLYNDQTSSGHPNGAVAMTSTQITNFLAHSNANYSLLNTFGPANTATVEIDYAIPVQFNGAACWTYYYYTDTTWAPAANNSTCFTNGQIQYSSDQVNWTTWTVASGTQTGQYFRYTETFSSGNSNVKIYDFEMAYNQAYP